MSFMIDRRSILNFDWVLLTLTLLLCGIGILNLVSAGGQSYAIRQAIWLVAGLGIIVFILLIDYNRFEPLVPFIYVGGLGLLLAAHFFGKEVSGAKSWIDLKYFNLQPSEIMKIGMILALARLFHRDKSDKPYSLRELWLPLLIIGLPVAGIVTEPDMGTALILSAVGATMLLVMGVERKALAIMILAGLLAAPPLWHWGLKPHQKERIKTLVQPGHDPLGAGYNALQSKIAIGSGGFSGKGFKKGTQNSLRFLPEQQTDFAFAVWAEEWGFVGVSILLGLFGLFIYRGIQTSILAKDRFGSMLAFGCTVFIFWHTAINLAMIGGIFPVIGIPLPFVSYGGSHMLTVMIATGLMLNVRMRRYVF